MPLDKPQQQALRAYSDAVRRLSVPDAIAPSEPEPDTLRTWIPSAAKALRRAAQAVSVEKLGVEAAISNAATNRSGNSDEAGWRALEDVCRRLEAEILSPPTLRARIEEGRRSMMPRIEMAINEKMTPIVTEQKGRLVASIDPDALLYLEKEMPQWIDAWSNYTFQWVNTDQQQTIDILWNPRGPNLPVPPPQLPPIKPVSVDRKLSFPTISIEKEQLGMLDGIMRHGRSVFFGTFMLSTVIGFAKNDPTIFIVAIPLAISYAYSQTLTARAQEREKAAEQVRQKTEQATREVLKSWLDRCVDKFNLGVQEQLIQRKTAFVEWYRAQVLRTREIREQEGARQQANADEARRKLPKITEQEREIQRAQQALTALESSLAPPAS